MGCGASSKVHVADEDGSVVSKPTATAKRGNKSNDTADDRSLISVHIGRGDSAGSKISQRSADSGFNDEEELHRQQLIGQ